LAADLERFLSGSPVAAVPVGEWERIVRLAAQDGYENLQEIGRGPCSVVYRAVRGPFDPPVALKVFRSSVCTQADWDARLRQSAAVRAGLSHPNLVPVRGAGWWDDRPYVAVDFVPQGSLDVKPDGRLLPIRRTLQLVEQVGEVVGYLHRQGVVHGNLKPSNVLFAPAGIPRVVDIHFTGGLFLGDRTAGTGVEYLAPELIADPELEPRQNVDVYGLGLILYGLLTGRPLFSAASTPELLDEVRWREPTPPSQFNPEVVPALDSVCLRCLRKNPWQRFTRVFDLVKQIRQLLGDPASNPIPPI
jgi:serine/threonine protein kinase